MKKKYNDFLYLNCGIVFYNEILEFKVGYNKIRESYLWDFWLLGV